MAETETVSRWKFTHHSRVKDTPPFEITTPIEFLKEKFDDGMIFGQQELKESGCYKQGGWMFDLRPWLKLFLVKQYGGWHQMYAPNKTAVRTVTYGGIERIVEIEQDRPMTMEGENDEN